MSDFERLLKSLHRMTEATQFMVDLPGSSEIKVDPSIVAGMERTAEQLDKVVENVRKMAERIVGASPNAPRGRIHLN